MASSNQLGAGKSSNLYDGKGGKGRPQAGRNEVDINRRLTLWVSLFGGAATAENRPPFLGVTVLLVPAVRMCRAVTARRRGSPCRICVMPSECCLPGGRANGCGR